MYTKLVVQIWCFGLNWEHCGEAACPRDEKKTTERKYSGNNEKMCWIKRFLLLNFLRTWGGFWSLTSKGQLKNLHPSVVFTVKFLVSAKINLLLWTNRQCPVLSRLVHQGAKKWRTSECLNQYKFVYQTYIYPPN